jgi:hypothetical protein
MCSNLAFGATRVALVCIVVTLVTDGASAVTVEVAKKCDALIAKAFPPRQIGNPAAGSDKGAGNVQRDYFKKCVANGGNMDDHAPKEAK